MFFFADFECPYCARAHGELATRADRVRVVFRHFPVRSVHRRAFALATAAEAAARQGAFWEYADSLFVDQGRVDPPHLWERARKLGLDLERFERDRRSRAVAARVERDIASGLRAGVVATPTFFVGGQRYTQTPPAL
ncbi:DsbA family protein [Thermoleophilum album]|uniref:DsbA family protein n=1 Tax=Thermoleophilum album TaxID=29539 RepID=UPI0031593FC4|nr:DsbA family protein [Thermoleophilum album]